MFCVTAKSISGYLCLFVALLRLGSANNESNKSQGESVNIQNFRSSFLETTAAKPPAEGPTYTSRQRRGVALQKVTCTVLPQPANGVHRKHEQYCPHSDYIKDCNIEPGVEVSPGAVLRYSCDPGYTITGSPNVSCNNFGHWSHIPVCRQVECQSPITMSTTGRCIRQGQLVNCDSPALVGTRARLSCRPEYKPATNQGGTTDCDVDGKWRPDPIQCVPVCGRITTGTGANGGDFPWHASVYWKWADGDDTTDFICSAIIIRPNLVLTAAHCIYDADTNMTKTASTLFVAAGQATKQWNTPSDGSNSVQKTAVRNVYINCDFWSVNGHSEADIALLEVEQPFQFTKSIAPICLEDSTGSGAHTNGRYDVPWEYTLGKPKVIKILSVKTVPHSECLSSGFITSDKFCSNASGANSGSPLCVQIAYGGLMVEREGLWHIVGIQKELGRVNFANHLNTCNHYSIYTKISEYMAWIQDVIFNIEQQNSHPPCRRDWSLVPASATTVAPTQAVTERIEPSTGDAFCSAPPQPANGQWQYQHTSCTNNDCKILQGAQLRPGSLLVYSCATGYKLHGNSEVYCGYNGKWSAIPVCTEIKCERLTSESRRASCSGRFGEYVSCDSPVPPGTWAQLSCATAFTTDTTFTTNQRMSVQCRENGQWLPEPIKCSPVCGLPITHQKPLVINGTAANIGDFPWHASLYRQTASPRLGIRKDFICGATVIQTNFLLTAAHCVYDEVTRTMDDPKQLFVMTGNIFQEYDSPLHNPVSVTRSAVKNVYSPCNYYGFRGNYVSDIALLELQDPFQLSSILLPACLDISGSTNKILEPGVYGRVAGFGRTAEATTSPVLQTLELPYIPYNQCQKSSNSGDSVVFISSDKFCAGYTNGSAVCEGDSGGGLVFKKGELWYVLGIVSVGLGVDLNNGERTCDRYSYSLYTKVTDHMPWIQDVMFQVGQNGFYRSCGIGG